MIKIPSIILFMIFSCPVHRCFRFSSITINIQKQFVMSYNASNKQKCKRIILGSGSKSRLDIIEAEGYQVQVIKADIDEKSIGSRKDASAADALVSAIAIAKADTILENLKAQASFQDLDKSTILLTADQVVVHKSEILEKPNDIEQARKYIESYVNNQCSTVGSIVLTNVMSGKRTYGVAKSTIYFGAIPNDVVEKLLQEPMVLNCAGGLMVEHPLVQPYIVQVDGSYNSLMGLCTDLLNTLLRELEDG